MAQDHETALSHPPWRRPSALVGRMLEQVFLREELVAASEGRGRLILLGGEAGIGKTTLAQDLAVEAAARGVMVLAGHCYDLTKTPPYGPWLDLIAGYPGGPSLPAPPAALAGGAIMGNAEQGALFAEVRRFIAELATFRPLLVLLEDLHWADPASLDLLRHLARQASRWPVLLLVTYRVDEPARRYPFFQQLPALARESGALRLDLRRLDTPALRGLVAARYPLADTDVARLTAYLDRHAEGNPFFTIELLRTLEEEGLLNARDGHWVLDELDHVVIPPFLRQVIEARVERLGPEARQALAVAAVIGQEASLDLLAEVAHLDDETLLAIVEQAVEAHILAAERDGVRVRFVHALTREALYEGILPPRRRAWHQQVARALTSGTNPDPDAVAYHLQQAGDPHAWEWLIQAADRAQRAYAWLTAAERLRDATALLAGAPGQEQRRARLLHRLARLSRFSDPAESLRVLEEAERLAVLLDDRILAAEILYIRGVVLSYLDQFRAGLEAVIAAAEALEAMPLEATKAANPTDPWIADALPEIAPIDLRGEDEAAALLHAAGLHFRRATQPWFLASVGQPHEAVAIARRFIAALEEAPGAIGGVRSAIAFSFHALGIAHAALGQPRQAQRAWERAREHFGEYGHHALTTYTLLTELRDVALTYHAADPEARRTLAAEAEAALARASGAFAPGISPRLAALGCLVLDGRWDEALGILSDLPDPANAYLRREVTAATALLARYRGEPEVAWAQIHPRFPEGPATAPGDHIHQEGLFLQRLAADLVLDAGDLAGAHDWLTAHDEWIAWCDCTLGQAEGQIGWARYHWEAREVALARARALEALALASEPDQPLVRLAAHRLLGEIETECDGLDAAEAHLAAALALAEMCEAPFERTLTLLAIAELRIAQGNAGEAIHLLHEVRAVGGALGAAPMLARADALMAHATSTALVPAYPAGLTQREVEVLRLLAQRQTDKEIAAALFLGTRTVQSHVAHILNKLGVANRREAAAEAERLGLL